MKKTPKKKIRIEIKLILIILIIAAGIAGFGFYLQTDFEAELHDVIVLVDERVMPSDFVRPGELKNGVSVSFLSEQSYLYTPGIHTVEFELKRHFRTKASTATLFVIEPVEYITIEFAEPDIYFSPYNFIKNPKILKEMDYHLSFVNELPPSETLPVGDTTVELILDDMLFTSIIRVVDTIPPIAVTRDIEMLMGEELSAGDFIVEAYDASSIALIEFLKEPNVRISGEQIVTIVIVDNNGNIATFDSFLTIADNDIPPVIEGAEDFEVVKNASIMFREGITAFDAFGRPLEVRVNTDSFNASVPGLYNVIIYAVDAWGLSARVDIKVRVIEVEPEYVRGLVDEILAGILNDDMTQVEEARAIFHWISWNMSTTPDIRRESVYEAALSGIQTRRGNCFTYYALAEVMLTRAGIPNMMIERIPNQPTTHRWNLINPDDRGWYHFDSMPTRARVNRFMFTSSQIEEMNEEIHEHGSPANYYTYLPHLYPEIVW